MEPKTTVVVILLAGNLDTVRQLDPLLWEIQEGVNFGGTNAPHVYCYYHRWHADNAPLQTHFFQIQRHTLQFNDQKLVQRFPALLAALHGGDIQTQLKNCMSYIETQETSSIGPFRVIIGAHGHPGVGVGPKLLLQILRLLWLMMMSPFDQNLRDLSWPGRFSILFDRVFSSNASPLGLSGLASRGAPDLKLDELSDILTRLPTCRLKTLILHTCKLSGIEATKSLDIVPHLIACEIDLSGQMPIHKWFPTLGDPCATEVAITKTCFDSILQASATDGSVKGRFSSHHTDKEIVVTLLNNLNVLGRQLNDLLMLHPASRATINRLRDDSAVSADIVDLAYFCTMLKDNGVVSPAVVDPIITALCSLRLATAIETEGIPQKPLYTGISVYFPEPGSPSAYPTSELPKYFRHHIKEWVKFLDTWIRLTAT